MALGLGPSNREFESHHPDLQNREGSALTPMAEEAERLKLPSRNGGAMNRWFIWIRPEREIKGAVYGSASGAKALNQPNPTSVVARLPVQGKGYEAAEKA